jgi:hypothetical protein
VPSSSYLGGGGGLRGRLSSARSARGRGRPPGQPARQDSRRHGHAGGRLDSRAPRTPPSSTRRASSSFRFTTAWGGDQWRTSWHYRGIGRVVFTRHNGYGDTLYVLQVEYDPSEGGGAPPPPPPPPAGCRGSAPAPGRQLRRQRSVRAHRLSHRPESLRRLGRRPDLRHRLGPVGRRRRRRVRSLLDRRALGSRRRLGLGQRLRLGLGPLPLRAVGTDRRARLGVDPGP